MFSSPTVCRWSRRSPRASPSCALANSWKWATPNRCSTSQKTTTPGNCWPPFPNSPTLDPLISVTLFLFLLVQLLTLDCQLLCRCARIPTLKSFPALVRSPSREGSTTQPCGGGVLDGYNSCSRAGGASFYQSVRPGYRRFLLAGKDF